MSDVKRYISLEDVPVKSVNGGNWGYNYNA